MWKEDERWWARLLHWKRFPSMGVAHPDVANVTEDGVVLATMEHKSTHQLPQFIVKAIDQARVNRAAFPDAPAYIGITYHSPSRKVYRLLCIEVGADDHDAAEVLLKEAA